MRNKKIKVPPKNKQTSNNDFNELNSFSNINYPLPKTYISGEDWFMVGASSIGKSHISLNKPCEDNHICNIIKDGWGIAVVCDGAGSAINSLIGSRYLSSKTANVFKDFLLFNKFVHENKLPNEVEWESISKLAFRSIYESLSDFTKQKKIEFNSVASTVILIVFTPIGLLSAHIGDGRAGYCDTKGEWKALITPHKGEETNQTIFVTSSSWYNVNDFTMSGVLVPECRVIPEKVSAFTLMSDGCESHSFHCSKMDMETNKWMDPNLPSEKFFNPLLKQLKTLVENKVSMDDITSSWINFVEKGTSGIRDEPDDKTLIIGILV